MSAETFGLSSGGGLHPSDILYLIREGEADDAIPVLVTHKHRTFKVVLGDVDEDGSLSLGLEEIDS